MRSGRMATVRKVALSSAVVAVMTAMWVPSAWAADAEVAGEVLTYYAGDGEVNQIRVEMDPLDALIITDEGAQVSAGVGCVALSDHVVSCASAIDGIAVFELGDLDDFLAPCDLCLVPSTHLEISAGPGDDTVDLGRINHSGILNGDDGDDALTGGEGGDALNGGDGNDVIDSGGGFPVFPQDSLDGGPGDDVLRLRTRSGTVRGGEGIDLVDYSFLEGPVVVNLGGVGGPVGGGFHFVDDDVENADGGSGDDIITGSSYDNQLDGGEGVDTIAGGEGDDVVISVDEWADHVVCGPGHDRVRADELDQIADDCEEVEVERSVWLLSENTVLTADHDGPVVVAGDDLTLDCAGHSISGFGEVGVKVEDREGVVIRNCRVSGFDVGFRLESSTDIQLDSNQVVDVGDISVQLIDTHDSQLGGNTSDRPGCDAFVLEGSSKNVLSDNSARDSGCSGFAFFDSSDNVLSRAVVTGSNFEGAFLSGSIRNVLEENSIADVGGVGIAMVGESSGNQVVGNDISRSGFEGIYVDESSANRLEENELRDSGTTGVLLASSTENVIRANLSSGSALQGFEADAGSSGNLYASNTARRNGGEGFAILSWGNRLIDNTAIGNSTGVVIAGSANRVEKNVANLNLAGGFYLSAGARDNMVLGNVAMRNGSAGFSTDPDAVVNSFIQNVACQNGTDDGAEDAIDSGSNNNWEANRFCSTAGL